MIGGRLKRAAARIAVLALAAVILAGTACGRCAAEDEDEADYYALYVMCRPGSFVHVREKPRKSSQVAGRLECGDQVWTLGEKRGQYIRIYRPVFEAADEWIHAGYLTEEEPEIWEDGEVFTVKAAGRVALRRYIRGKRRAWAKPGRRLTVYAMTAEWALTSRGYIRTEYLEDEAEEEEAAEDAA